MLSIYTKRIKQEWSIPLPEEPGSELLALGIDDFESVYNQVYHAKGSDQVSWCLAWFV